MSASTSYAVDEQTRKFLQEQLALVEKFDKNDSKAKNKNVPNPTDPKKEKKCWCIIEKTFIENWLLYVQGKNPPPGEIDNSSLLIQEVSESPVAVPLEEAIPSPKKRNSIKNKIVKTIKRKSKSQSNPPVVIDTVRTEKCELIYKPKRDLQLKYHYRAVSPEVWVLLQCIYGGGGLICRKTPDIYGKRVKTEVILVENARKKVTDSFGPAIRFYFLVEKSKTDPKMQRSIVLIQAAARGYILRKSKRVFCRIIEQSKSLPSKPRDISNIFSDNSIHSEAASIVQKLGQYVAVKKAQKVFRQLLHAVSVSIERVSDVKKDAKLRVVTTVVTSHFANGSLEKIANYSTPTLKSCQGNAVWDQNILIAGVTDAFTIVFTLIQEPQIQNIAGKKSGIFLGQIGLPVKDLILRKTEHLTLQLEALIHPLEINWLNGSERTLGNGKVHVVVRSHGLGKDSKCGYLMIKNDKNTAAAKLMDKAKSIKGGEFGDKWLRVWCCLHENYFSVYNDYGAMEPRNVIDLKDVNEVIGSDTKNCLKKDYTGDRKHSIFAFPEKDCQSSNGNIVVGEYSKLNGPATSPIKKKMLSISTNILPSNGQKKRTPLSPSTSGLPPQLFDVHLEKSHSVGGKKASDNNSHFIPNTSAIHGKNTMELYHFDLQTEEKKFYFCCEKEDDRDIWVGKLKRCLKKFRVTANIIGRATNSNVDERESARQRKIAAIENLKKKHNKFLEDNSSLLEAERQERMELGKKCADVMEAEGLFFDVHGSPRRKCGPLTFRDCSAVSKPETPISL